MLVEYTFTRSDGSKLVMDFPYSPYDISYPERELETDNIFILEIFENEKAYECTVILSDYHGEIGFDEVVWEHRYTLADFTCSWCHQLDECRDLACGSVCDACWHDKNDSW